MGNKLVEAIKGSEQQYLENPELLYGKMKECGYSERDCFSVMLLMKCCPAIPTILAQKCPDDLETKSMLRSALVHTGLNIIAIRRALGILFRICGYQIMYIPKPKLKTILAGWNVRPETTPEESFPALLVQLQVEPCNSELLCNLHQQCEDGNAQAAYALGQHLLNSDQPELRNLSLQYFKKAADMGFAPAGAATALCLVRRNPPRYAEAAAYLDNPASLYGSEGRKWASASDLVLKYRKENLARHRLTLLSQVVMLIFSFVLFSTMVMPLDVWCRLSRAVQIAGILRTLLVMVFNPCVSCTGSGAAMMLGWLLLIFHL